MSIQLQLRRGTSTQWTAANPILAEGELAVELNTKLYKIGDGVTPWNNLTYGGISQPGTANVINYSNQSTPSTPPADTLNIFAKSLANRMLLHQQGPSGLVTPLQTSFFQNNIAIISTGSGTTLNVIGTGSTSSGTISHPVPSNTEGYMANIVTSGSANGTAGTGDSVTRWFPGSSLTGSAGFFFYARMFWPDSSYNQSGTSTGSRSFVGLTNSAITAVVSADNPAAGRVGFSFINVNSGLLDTHWHVTSRPVTGSETRASTGLSFIVQNVYDFYMFSPPIASAPVYWRIDNVTAGTTASGTIVDSLPTATTPLRAGFCIQSINAAARNVRFQRIYVESDF